MELPVKEAEGDLGVNEAFLQHELKQQGYVDEGSQGSSQEWRL